MGLLSPVFLDGVVDDDTAWRIIAMARSIAPCIDTVEGDALSQVIAILKGVAKEFVERGSRHIGSQSVPGASVRYVDVKSCFFPDDRDALRSLCSAGADTGGPIGEFPRAGIVDRLFPENC